MARRLGRDKPGRVVPPGPGGTMPLVGHLRELRQRTVKSVLAILAGTVTAWFFYDAILSWLSDPYEEIRPALEAKGIETMLAITGVGGAFSFQLKISLIVGLILTSPLWLWQIWAFVLPALHRNEKRWALLLTGVGAPLFIGGAYLGYVVMPKAFEVLLGFVPEGWQSLLTGADYLDFIIRMLLVFGVAAEIPLVVIMLNRLGIVSFEQLRSARPWTIIGIFVFSAVATPSTDPLTMLFLASPMTLLYFIAENIARFTDRRRKRADATGLADDELSAIDEDADPGDSTLSGL
ncbi:twin-arginine translocase subunit TatC [Aeromicrobium sp.]